MWNFRSIHIDIAQKNTSIDGHSAICEKKPDLQSWGKACVNVYKPPQCSVEWGQQPPRSNQKTFEISVENSDFLDIRKDWRVQVISNYPDGHDGKTCSSHFYGVVFPPLRVGENIFPHLCNPNTSQSSLSSVYCPLGVARKVSIPIERPPPSFLPTFSTHTDRRTGEVTGERWVVLVSGSIVCETGNEERTNEKKRKSK